MHKIENKCFYLEINLHINQLLIQIFNIVIHENIILYKLLFLFSLLTEYYCDYKRNLLLTLQQTTTTTKQLIDYHHYLY